MTRILSVFIALFLLAACGGKVERNYNDYHPQVGEDLRDSKMSSILTKSDESVVIFSSNKKASENGSGSGMAGSYLWKAALESIAFMPLVSSDSNGGAILTDWYAAPETPNEQFKFNIFILSPELQITSVKVTAFKQVKNGAGQWQVAKVNNDLARSIEDKILHKAISLKARSTSDKK